MQRFIFTVIFFLSGYFSLTAQYFIRGSIMNTEGKLLPGAIIRITGTYLGTSSNADGEYNIRNLKQPEIEVEVKLMGYVSQTKRINLADKPDVDWRLAEQPFIADEVVITSTRADDKSGMTFSTLEKKEMGKQNFGQDLPLLLNTQPSVVVSSDAGNGIGYTGIRIRGSDPTRTNVTINGIPYNDAESHSVYWVNMPDFASSIKSLQIQRGVGSSTNGAGAFGATLNLQTNEFRGDPYASFTSSAGSFNTLRNTLELGTGLINGFTFDLRMSKILSDGYVDRAKSDLQSLFGSLGWYQNKTSIRLNVFSGKEKTYQAWYGVPQDSIKTNPRYNWAGLYTDAKGNISYYDNQTDNYRQTHYQAFFNHELRKNLICNLALHYTKGSGYYEEYREQDFLINYGVPELVIPGADTIKKSDLIRQLWLDNDFYGTVFSAIYSPSNTLKIIAGGGLNEYVGSHFGEVIWAEFAQSIPKGKRYYADTARKKDANIYVKTIYDLGRGLSLFADIQYRNIYYSFKGINDQLNDIRQNANLNFMNPKAGITWDMNDRNRVYLSYSIASREPVRSDYTDSKISQRPEPEKMGDFEMGYRHKRQKINIGLTTYYMRYKNQLVLTGALNEVGYPLRVNTPDSYRVGIEFEVGWCLSEKFIWTGNFTLSRNKIVEFSETVYDEQTFTPTTFLYKNSDISFSPGVISSSVITWKAMHSMDISFTSKYVGRQFLDNTGSEQRMLGAFHIHSLQINWSMPDSKKPKAEFGFQINNIFDTQYFPNGYTYSGLNGTIRSDYNFFYPQAGRNFLAMVKIGF